MKNPTPYQCFVFQFLDGTKVANVLKDFDLIGDTFPKNF